MVNPGLSRKQGVGSEFTDFGLWDDNKAKRAKVINLDNSDDEEDDYSLGFSHRSTFKLGKTERRKAENEAYLAEPEVRNRDIGQQHWLGFVNETIANAKEGLANACRFAFGDYWISPKSEGNFVGRDPNCAFSPELTDDLDKMVNENQCVSKENSDVVSRGLVDDSVGMLFEESCIAQELSSELAPEVECRRLDGSIDCEVVDHCNCEPDTGNSKGVGVSLTDSFAADQIREHLRSLKFPCTDCHEPILSGNRWSCKQCKNFHLCERCIEGKQSQQSRDGLRTHTTNRGEKHALIQTLKNVADTDDKDIIIDNGMFENRQFFELLSEQQLSV